MRFYKKTTITRGSDDKPYLIRYSLFSCRFFAIKVHNILLSDDECLHDHPWPFLTFLLSGGYFEHSIIKHAYKRFRYYGRFSLLYRPADYVHRLVIYKPVWTLVITFKKVRDWGFYTPRGFVNWRSYQPNENGRCE
jgi:hypothetical protein